MKVTELKRVRESAERRGIRVEWTNRHRETEIPRERETVRK